MASITQDMRYRLSLIRFAEKYGVSKAAIKYKTNRQYIYRWKRRYDGTIESLRDRSRRPHHHPNQHTPEEIKLIQDMRRRNPHAGLVVFWVKLMQRGYKRSIPGLYRFLKKQGIMAQKLPNPKYIPKPYEQMRYPGQRIQIDVKFVLNSWNISLSAFLCQLSASRQIMVWNLPSVFPLPVRKRLLCFNASCRNMESAIN